MAGSVRDLNNGGGNLRLPLRDWPPPPPLPPTQPAAAAPLCCALQKQKEREEVRENEGQNKANNKLMQLSVKCGQCARTKQVNAITLRWHFTPLPPHLFSPIPCAHILPFYLQVVGGEGETRFFTRCELRLIVVSKMICLHPPHSCRRRRRRCLLRMLCLHTKCAAVSDTVPPSTSTTPPPGSAYHPVSPFRNCSS